MAKRRSSLYFPGERSAALVKVKTTTEAELVIAGRVESVAAESRR